MIHATWPLQRAAEPESCQENVACSSQAAAPLLPASSLLNLLVRTLAAMLPITALVSKRQQNSGGGRQLTTLAADPPQVALEPAVAVPTYFERNCQAIVAGVPPLTSHPQTKGNREQAECLSWQWISMPSGSLLETAVVINTGQMRYF